MPGSRRVAERSTGPGCAVLVRRWPEAVAWLILTGLAGCGEPVRQDRDWTALGRRALADVHARSESVADGTLDGIARAMERAEAAVSGDPGSLLVEVNRRAPRGVRVEDADFYRLVRRSLAWARATDGAFDPTVGAITRLYAEAGEGGRPDPEELSRALGRVGWTRVETVPDLYTLRFRDPALTLDLSGVAEGWAVDLAARSFARVGCLAGIVRLGSTVYVWGSPPEASPRAVSLPGPEDPAVDVEVTNRAVSTCSGSDRLWTPGGYVRVPVVDPSTGAPAEPGVRWAAAVADSAAQADAVSGALWVGGARRAGSFLRRLHRVEAAMLVREASGPVLLMSASLKSRSKLRPELGAARGVKVRYLLPPRRLEGP